MCGKIFVLLFQTDQELWKGKVQKNKAIFMRPDGWFSQAQSQIVYMKWSVSLLLMTYELTNATLDECNKRSPNKYNMCES